MTQHRIVTNITHHLKQKGGLKKNHFKVEAKIGGGMQKVIVKFVHDDHRSRHEERLKELAAVEEFELEFEKLNAA